MLTDEKNKAEDKNGLTIYFMKLLNHARPRLDSNHVRVHYCRQKEADMKQLTIHLGMCSISLWNVECHNSILRRSVDIPPSLQTV